TPHQTGDFLRGATFDFFNGYSGSYRPRKVPKKIVGAEVRITSALAKSFQDMVNDPVKQSMVVAIRNFYAEQCESFVNEIRSFNVKYQNILNGNPAHEEATELLALRRVAYIDYLRHKTIDVIDGNVLGAVDKCSKTSRYADDNRLAPAFQTNFDVDGL